MKKIHLFPSGLFKILWILMISVILPVHLFSQIKITKTDASCGGVSNGSATVEVTGGTPPYSYVWSIGSTDQTVNNLQPGQFYAVSVTDSHGCSGNDSIFIETIGDLKLTIQGTNPEIKFCRNQGSSEIILTAVASGGSQPYSYSWPGASKLINSNGKYFCTVTDSNLCLKMTSIDVLFIPVQCAIDPNEIVGPSGFGEEQWVSVNDKLPYSVYFENDPDFATASAQQVSITLPISNKADMYSLKLGDFGFGNFVFSVPPNTSYYSTRLDVVDSLGVYVDLIAGLDVNTQNAFWIFQAIDPATGMPPIDPQSGFLPVNDSISHHGEGFVTFTLEPKLSDLTGDSIETRASINFDINEAVGTNTWKNHVDAFPPTSAVNPLPAAMGSTTFAISFSGQDDLGGCGIWKFQLYFSKDSGPYTLYGEYDSGSSAQFTGMESTMYKFFSIAIDHVGNTEPMKTIPDVITTITQDQATNILFSDVQSNRFSFNWTDGHGARRAVFIKQDSMGLAIPLNNTTYLADTVFGSGSQIGSTGWYCVFNGTTHALGVTVSNLLPESIYRVKVCEYIGESGAEQYIVINAAGNPANQQTCTPVAVAILILSSANPVCAGTSVTFTATPTNGGSNPYYQWQVNAINVNNANNAVFTYIPANNDVVSCILTSNVQCPLSNPDTSNPIVMVINLLPVPVINGPTQACPNIPGNLYSTTPSMTNYNWNVSGGTITAGGGSSSDTVTVTWPTSGIFTVSLNYTDLNGCTALNSSILSVSVNNGLLPSPAGTISGMTVVNVGQSGVAYSVPAIPLATGYIWQLPPGATIATGENTQNITVDFSGTATSGTIQVQGTNACGNGLSSPVFNVTVRLPIPSVREVTNINITNGQSECYDALQTVTIAGNSSIVTVQNGGQVNVIAGQVIDINPLTKVYPGGYFHAWITTNGVFCNPLKSFLSAETTIIQNSSAIDNRISNNRTIRVYPNPTTGSFTIEFPDSEPLQTKVSIFGMRGEKILEQEAILTNSMIFSLEGEQPGIYFIHTVRSNRIENAKIIKQ